MCNWRQWLRTLHGPPSGARVRPQSPVGLFACSYLHASHPFAHACCKHPRAQISGLTVGLCRRACSGIRHAYTTKTKRLSPSHRPAFPPHSPDRQRAAARARARRRQRERAPPPAGTLAGQERERVTLSFLEQTLRQQLAGRQRAPAALQHWSSDPRAPPRSDPQSAPRGAAAGMMARGEVRAWHTAAAALGPSGSGAGRCSAHAHAARRSGPSVRDAWRALARDRLSHCAPAHAHAWRQPQRVGHDTLHAAPAAAISVRLVAAPHHDDSHPPRPPPTRPARPPSAAYRQSSGNSAWRRSALVRMT